MLHLIFVIESGSKVKSSVNGGGNGSESHLFWLLPFQTIPVLAFCFSKYTVPVSALLNSYFYFSK